MKNKQLMNAFLKNGRNIEKKKLSFSKDGKNMFFKRR